MHMEPVIGLRVNLLKVIILIDRLRTEFYQHPVHPNLFQYVGCEIGVELSYHTCGSWSWRLAKCPPSLVFNGFGKEIVAPLSGQTRLADPNRFRDARLILFVYFSFFCLFFVYFLFFIFYFVKVSRIESPARLEGRIRTRAQFTPTVFIYIIKTFYLCHFLFEFAITRNHFQMVGP